MNLKRKCLTILLLTIVTISFCYFRVKQAYAVTYEFETGFEEVDPFGNWTPCPVNGYGYEIQTDIVHGGVNACRSKEDDGYMTYELASNYSQHYCLSYFYINGTVPEGYGGGIFIRVWDVEITVYIETNASRGAGKSPYIRFYDQMDDDFDVLDPEGLALATWHSVEVYTEGDSASANHKCWVNGRLIADVSDDTSGWNITGVTIESYYWTDGYTGKVIHDDFASNNDVPMYYFNFDFNDLDSNDVQDHVTWALWNSTHDLDYTEGETSLYNGTYYVKTTKYGDLINTTTLDTGTYGNSTIDINLNMKAHQSCSNGYIVSNDTISSINIHTQTPQLLNFTIDGNTPVQLGVGVPKNASYITETKEGYEDYTSYTELDDNNHIDYTSDHVTHEAWRNEDAYLYDDKGSDHFGDFEHFLDFRYNFSASIRPTGGIWGLTNYIDDFYGMRGSQNYIYMDCMGEWVGYIRPYVRLIEVYGGNLYYNEIADLSDETWYYVRIKKSGLAYSCKIWTDATDRDNDDTGAGSYVTELSLTLHTDDTYQYVFACNTNNNGGNYWFTTEMENLFLQELTSENITDWTYVPSPKHVHLTRSSFSTYTFHFPSTDDPVIGPQAQKHRVQVDVTLFGDPVKGANVSIEGKGKSTWGLTDLFGRTIFKVKTGTYDIRATYSGYVQTRSLFIKRNIRIVIELGVEREKTEEEAFLEWLGLPEIDFTSYSFWVLVLPLILLVIYGVKRALEGPKRKWKYSYLD